ncbi:MAG: phenylalanine--tRNA ligase subunit beta [Pseudomonadota bacterium]|nr:phenylalanine--tRNA ligase subunit beta [Pseudomonadota bacterium]
MKFSEAWLREWIDPGVDTETLARRLTMAGLEVDAVEPVSGVVSDVVVAEVVATAPHPDAERLRVCQVDDGTQRVQVVCGAENVRVGIKVPLVRPGAQLPDGTLIQAAQIRGQGSAGMLAAASELGFEDAIDGLWEFPLDAPAGVPLSDYLGLDDTVIEVDLTPNRADCLSILGLAREVGLITDQPFKGPDPVCVEVSSTVRPDVQVDDWQACPRFLARSLSAIDLPNAVTPIWIRERLRRSGFRSIDPVVDVTNYVMLELGQPMHAYDADQVSGALRVRRARAQEQLRTLDGKALELDSSVLVIADNECALGMAGVMGGANSGVGANTRNLVLECAHFIPEVVAGRARRFGLQSEAAHRFERGVDPELPRRALERATELLVQLVGGTVGPIVEVSDPQGLPSPTRIPLRIERIRRLLGLPGLEASFVRGLLQRMGAAVDDTAGSTWAVTPPTHRFDLAIEEDLVEEVGRLYGYDQIPVSLPAGPLRPPVTSETLRSTRALRDLLVATGYQEAITYSFVDPVVEQALGGPAPLQLQNPMSADMSVMRTTLWSGLLPAVSYNLNRQQPRVRLFETGLRFLPLGDGLRQEPVIAGAATGSRWPEGWTDAAEGVDFFDAKGDVERLLRGTGEFDAFRFVAGVHPALHPGQTAQVLREDESVGWLGALHPKLAASWEIDQPVFLFELAVEPLLRARVPSHQPLGRFPSVRRDLAFLVDVDLPYDRLREAVEEGAGPLLEQLSVFDLYQGEGIDPKRKSIALGLTLRDRSRTLVDSEVQAAVDQVVALVQDRCAATLR